MSNLLHIKGSAWKGQRVTKRSLVEAHTAETGLLCIVSLQSKPFVLVFDDICGDRGMV
jgi:hypothetical protein